jgi:DNA gyrase subunit B
MSKKESSQIEVLEASEAIRRRPDMFVGGIGISSLHFCLYLVLDSCVDEALAGFCHNIEISIDAQNIVTITDDGQGIATDLIPQAQKSYLLESDQLLTKFDNEIGLGKSFEISGSLHRLGAIATNALSEWLSLEVKHGGYHYYQSFQQGVPVSSLKSEKLPTEQSHIHGTTVRWLADIAIFTDGINYNFDTLCHHLQEVTLSTKALRIKLIDERLQPIQVADFYYENK